MYADAFLEVSAPLQLSRNLVSSYLPAGYTLKVPITVTAPRDTPPGRYAVTVRSGERRLSVPVEVVPGPVDTTGNLARYVPVTASSENLPLYPACGAVDGDRDSNHWATTTGWNDANKGSFPDWLQVTFDRPETVGRVDLYTLDSTKYPAARYGLRDWDVQVRVGESWQTVAQVRGNVAGLVSSTFTPVTATAFRILTLASNETAGYSRVVELGRTPPDNGHGDTSPYARSGPRRLGPDPASQGVARGSAGARLHRPRGGRAVPDVVALGADGLGHQSEPHEPTKDRAAHAEGEHRLQGGRHDHRAQDDVRRAVLTETQCQHAGGDGQCGSDALGEPLGRTGNELLPYRQPGRDHPSGE
ncbi:hypothetical protein GCM10027614_37400 [Micromonospora vulcania]